MYDLAAELGSTVVDLARVMPEKEFFGWQKYAAHKMLPHRRVEMYLAQIAYLIAVSMGGATGVKLKDFMFDPQEPESEELQKAIEYFNFKPINIKE